MMVSNRLSWISILVLGALCLVGLCSGIDCAEAAESMGPDCHDEPPAYERTCCDAEALATLRAKTESSPSTDLPARLPAWNAGDRATFVTLTRSVAFGRPPPGLLSDRPSLLCVSLT